MNNSHPQNDQDLFETKGMYNKLTDICFCEEMQDPELYMS